MYCEAGITVLKQWVYNIRSENYIGRQLVINTKWTQLYAGIAEDILYDVTTHLPHLPIGRISWMRGFLYDVKGQLTSEEKFVPQKNLLNDIAIMDIILTLPLSDKEIITINKTLLHLQVYWISEILDVYSLSVHPFFLFHTTTPPSTWKLVWPTLHPPTSYSKQLWNRNIRIALAHYKNTQEHHEIV